ncbi:MAG: PEP-CTERM sorting domain-containing protein [Myxococcota bacterium]
MLRSSFGPTSPSLRIKRAIRGTALAVLAVCLPGLASAASVTFDVLDPSGFGATVTLADGEVPGTVNIDITNFGPDEGDLTGDILGIYLLGEDALLAGLDASGEDVDGVTAFTGTDFVDHIVDIGAGGIWTLNGIQSTSFVYSSTTDVVSVEALVGSQLAVWIGFDATQGPVPGSTPSTPDISVIKPIAVIPEPGTAALMLLGLMGLAATSRRFGNQTA